jgi:hypothetical protein
MPPGVWGAGCSHVIEEFAPASRIAHSFGARCEMRHNYFNVSLSNGFHMPPFYHTIAPGPCRNLISYPTFGRRMANPTAQEIMKYHFRLIAISNHLHRRWQRSRQRYPPHRRWQNIGLGHAGSGRAGKLPLRRIPVVIAYYASLERKSIRAGSGNCGQ